MPPKKAVDIATAWNGDSLTSNGIGFEFDASGYDGLSGHFQLPLLKVTLPKSTTPVIFSSYNLFQRNWRNIDRENIQRRLARSTGLPSSALADERVLYDKAISAVIDRYRQWCCEAFNAIINDRTSPRLPHLEVLAESLSGALEPIAKLLGRTGPRCRCGGGFAYIQTCMNGAGTFPAERLWIMSMGSCDCRILDELQARLTATSHRTARTAKR